MSSNELYLFLVQVQWDAEEFMWSAKDTVEQEGEVSAANASLPKFFPDANLGTISSPAIIIDKHGRILLYYLPGDEWYVHSN
jgi:hypothetical protein